MNILLSASTRHDVEHFIANPGHALGIIAEQGSGKFHLAEYIALTILDRQSAENNTELFIVRPNDKSTIPIESVRGITSFLRLKSASPKPISRVVLIDSADHMTTEAQNALLKTLEEPPKDAVIIMTISNQSRLLPTIMSRISNIDVSPVDKQQLVEFFSVDHQTHDIEKFWLLSGGRIGLLSALLTDKEHPLIPYIATAKEILAGSKHQRVLMVDKLAKDNLEQVLNGLLVVSTAAFQQSANNASEQQAKRWHTIRSKIYDTRSLLPHNPNAKLLLTGLMLEL